MYDFELFSSFNNDQLRGLLGDLFRSAPQEHVMVIWAKLGDGVDLQGIFRDAANPGQQQFRLKYRGSLEHRSVETAMLAWKYMVNLSPEDVEVYKCVAFDIWRGLPFNSSTYKAIMPLNHPVCDIPVPDSTDQTQNIIKSSFSLSAPGGGLGMNAGISSDLES